MNGYALMNSMGMYEGQRSVAPDQRVFILTRSGFAGIQRYATATWSGDTFVHLVRHGQADCGRSGLLRLRHALLDDGHWRLQHGKQVFPESNPGKCRGMARTQRPMVRVRDFLSVHPPAWRIAISREPWAFGGEEHPAYQAIVKFDRLRYSLLPYALYSLAGAIAHDSGTMMRPFIMDFPQDTVARKIANEYMFGPAFLVAPVTAPSGPQPLSLFAAIGRRLV